MTMASAPPDAARRRQDAAAPMQRSKWGRINREAGESFLFLGPLFATGKQPAAGENGRHWEQ